MPTKPTTRDPNRFVTGLEADALRSRINDEELELDVLHANRERAKLALDAAQARFHAIEEQYLLHKALVDDASKYLADAELKLDAQHASVTTHRALFHPVRKLPLEILGHIFILALGDTALGRPIPQSSGFIRSMQVLPFTLASVCRRWRQASLEHPRAWSHMYISFDSIKKGTERKLVQFIDIILSRSRAVPIIVSISHKREPRPYHQPLIGHVLRATRKASAIQLSLAHFAYESDMFLPILTAEYPKLLRARVELPIAGPASPTNVRLFPGAVALACLEGIIPFPSAAFRFPALKEARLLGLSCRDGNDVLAALLKASPFLRTLHLTIPSIRNRGLQPRIVAAHLELLALSVGDTCPLEALARRVEFPRLRTLTLVGDVPSGPQRVAFLATLVHTSPDISVLSISDLDEQTFLTMTGILPTLSRLETLLITDASHVTRNVLAALSRALQPEEGSASEQWPCPKLSGIAFGAECTFVADCDPRQSCHCSNRDCQHPATRKRARLRLSRSWACFATRGRRARLYATGIMIMASVASHSNRYNRHSALFFTKFIVAVPDWKYGPTLQPVMYSLL